MLSLRRMLVTPRPAGRVRLRMLSVLAFVMLAQALAFNHLIGHAASGDNAGCAICLSASHAGNALPASPIHADLPRLTERPAVPAVTAQFYESPPAFYRQRAPPTSA